MNSTTTRRPIRRGVKVRTLRTRGEIAAGTVCTVVDVKPHGGGYRYLIIPVQDDWAMEEWIAGRDVRRATPKRRVRRREEVSQ